MNPIKLTVIWVELWAPTLAVTVTALTLPTPPTIATTIIALILLTKSWRNGALTKNVTDTYALYARHIWRRSRSEHKLPKLIAVTVTHPMGIRDTIRTLRIEGKGSIPAHGMRLTIRPNDDEGDPTWQAKLENWVARRYGYQVADTTPSELSTNLLDITLTQHLLPGMVPAVDDLPNEVPA